MSRFEIEFEIRKHVECHMPLGRNSGNEFHDSTEFGRMEYFIYHFIDFYKYSDGFQFYVIGYMRFG